MTRTEELDLAIKRDFAAEFKSGRMIALEVSGDEYAKREPGNTFPSPTADWGAMTHTAFPNPKHRWWSFWRPWVLVQTIPVPIRLSNYAVASDAACSTLSPEAVMKNFAHSNT